MADIKPEIKVDAADGRNMADIDEFEEDTDLTIPSGDQQAWLIKVDEPHWKAWKQIYDGAGDNEVIEIGKMRVYNATGPSDDPLKQRITMRLHKHRPEHAKILKEYNLSLTTSDYNNLCVFSEKDLPGHPAPGVGRNRFLRPTGIQAKTERYGKDGRVNYRTAIPKQTALAPKIVHEGNATPIDNDEYQEHIKRQWAASVAPKNTTMFTNQIDRTMHPGLNTFQTFGISARPKGAPKRSGKVVRDKAVRMEQGELLKALEDCFRRFRYWGMKSLRDQLKQPEAWIKENLESIATLVRSGDFAMTWQLKPEYANVIQDIDDVKEEVAKVESDTDMATGEEMGGYEDDGDDDLGEFEDVKMEGASGLQAISESHSDGNQQSQVQRNDSLRPKSPKKQAEAVEPPIAKPRTIEIDMTEARRSMHYQKLKKRFWEV